MSARRSSRNRDTAGSPTKNTKPPRDDNIDNDDITVETVSKIQMFNEVGGPYEHPGDRTRRGKTTKSREALRREKMEREKELNCNSDDVTKLSLKNHTELIKELPLNKGKSPGARKSKAKSSQNAIFNSSEIDNKNCNASESMSRRPGRPPKSSKTTRSIPLETKPETDLFKAKDDAINDFDVNDRPTRGRSTNKAQPDGVQAISNEPTKNPQTRRNRRKSASPRKAVNSYELNELESDTLETGTINFPISNGLPSKRKSGRLRSMTVGATESSIEPLYASQSDIPTEPITKKKRGRPRQRKSETAIESIPLHDSKLEVMPPSNADLLHYQCDHSNTPRKKNAARPKQGRGKKNDRKPKETANTSNIDEAVYKKWKNELVTVKTCVCPICKIYRRKDINSMILHYNTCTPIDTDCRLCSPVKPFTTLPGLKYHLAVVHAQLHANPKNLSEEEIEEKIFSKLHSKINCPKCQTPFRSLARYRHHKTICGRENEVVDCPECKVSLNLVDLKDHMFMEHKIGEPDSDTSDAEPVSSEPKELMATGATKRSAAKRAIKTMKTLGEDNDVEGPIKDGNIKKKKGKIKLEFEENVCDSGSEYDVAKDKEDSTDGESLSEVDENEDDYNASEEETPRKPSRVIPSKDTTSASKYKYSAKYWVKRLPIQASSFGASLEKIFQKQYYSEEPIKQWHTCNDDWLEIKPDEKHAYLLQKLDISLSIKETAGSIKEVCLSRFGVHQDRNSVSIFAGGPIWSLAWCPTPVSQPGATQFLAVGSHRDAEETFSWKYPSSSPGLIQIWDCGNLHFRNAAPVTPKLAMTIAHEWGGVWAMKWCPNGAWEKDNLTDSPNLPRLGLLALACSDGTVRIISIPHPQSLVNLQSESDTVNPPMYKARGVIELRPTASGTKFGNCLCIDWCIQDNCGQICGSFGNGFVCLWNIYSTSPLISSGLDTKNPIFMPYKVFQAECFPLKAIAFCPQNSRYLVTGGTDQHVRFWDTKQTSFPVKEIPVGPITSICWPDYLGNLFVVTEDGFGPASGLFSIIWENGDFESSRLFTTACTINQVSHNHWLDTVTVGTVPGTIFGYIPTGDDTAIRLRYKYDHNRKYLLCKTLHEIENKESPRTSFGSQTPERSLIDTDSATENEEGGPKSKENESDTSTNNQKVSMKLTLEDTPLSSIQSSIRPINEFINSSSLSSELPTLTSINRLTWNPNYKSCHWLASGSESGILRLHCVSGFLPSN